MPSRGHCLYLLAMSWRDKIRPNVLVLDALLLIGALVFHFTSEGSEIPAMCMGAIIYSVKDLLGKSA